MLTNNEKSLAHHKVSTDISYISYPKNNKNPLERITYGVPAPRRMLNRSILNKKHFNIVTYLKGLGLTSAERQVTLELLRLYAYYGKVYPKANQFEDIRGCSRRSFWRAIAKLEELEVIERINRYLNHRQVSNAYRLDKLVLCLVRYLTEHGLPFINKFAKETLKGIGANFWQVIDTLKVRLRDPIPITTMA